MSSADVSIWERREMAAADRRIAAFDQAARALYQKSLAREKKERIFLYCILAGVSLFVFAVWYTEGRLLDQIVDSLRRVERVFVPDNGSMVSACRRPENRNTPYCQNRANATQRQWKTLMGGGKGGNQFTLHGE